MFIKQEECAENISNLVHSLPLESSLLFYKRGMALLMNEWFVIDQLLLDKFLMVCGSVFVLFIYLIIVVCATAIETSVICFKKRKLVKGLN